MTNEEKEIGMYFIIKGLQTMGLKINTEKLAVMIENSKNEIIITILK